MRSSASGNTILWRGLPLFSSFVEEVEGGWGELDNADLTAFSSDSYPVPVKQRLIRNGHGKKEGKVVARTGRPRGGGYLAPLVTSGLRTYDDNGCTVAAAAVLRVGAMFCSVRTRQRTVP